MPTTYNSLIRTPSPLVVALLPKRQQLDGSACSSWESLVGFDARVSCGSTGRKPCGLTRRGVSRFISCVRLRNRHACSLPFARTTRRPTLEPSTSAILSEACSETLFWRCFLGHPDRRLLQVCFQMLRQILWAGTSHAKGIVVEKIGIEAKQSLAL